MTEIWKYSIAVDEIIARRTGCFTTLPIRIHCRDDIANQATLKSVKDWGQSMKDGWDKKSGSALCSVGNWCSFIFPESLPERLDVITYLTNLGNIHDDACEEMSSEKAVEAHSELSQALDIHSKVNVNSGSKTSKLKAMVSQCLLDCINHDRNLGMKMLESYRTKWLDVMEHPDIHQVQTIEEYLIFRNLNGGMEPFWLMCQFGMAIDLTDKELQSVRHIFVPAESALVMTNDYWSWDREYFMSKRANAAKMVNSIDLFIRTQGLTVEEAREKVRNSIIIHEKEYLALKADFYESHPQVSLALKRYIEVCGVIVAGNHYWCANCPRHNDWQKNFDEGYAQTHIINEMSITTNPKKRKTPDADSNSSGSNFDSGFSSERSLGMKTPRTSISESSLSHLDEAIWRKPADTAIMEPINYINSLPSKGVRTMLIEAIDQWLGVPPQSLKIIKEIVDQLHNASLILDDIEDDSPLRRMNPAAHTVFGQSQSINSANFMFVCAVKKSRQLENSTAVDIVLEELECLYLGQSWDLFYKENLRCPSESEYLTMVDNKTGVMFRMLTRLMQGENTKEYIDFSHLTLLFGRYFQIRDDYMNISSSEYSEQKGFCEDLDEGKFSYPLVHCLQDNPVLRVRILGIFREKAASSNQGVASLPIQTKLYILKEMKASGAMDKTLSSLKKLEEELVAEFGRLEASIGMENPMLRLLLSVLAVP
ncbi:hypothetical protein ONS95_013796 [Cadophora gregata]|uniref:uncharacterized protein n=1 Tax=Cadophora gregata TaxID=51156 RepID=UPI0026DC1F8D|nr:uncharacterized protein ONS95_013796 [Cadophora gregata]KAK0113545.1 hypothetical protein ONS96_014404 [Cadophora gregata f. sp. sojae]KAK0114302.1 hypothetical protein ONS95_013796 [Cadophora gregata]